MEKTRLIRTALLVPLAVACGRQEQERPNILLIVADDLGLGDVSAYGSTTIDTPNIDSLASVGVRFTNGYATSATSTPSRYALFTGVYPWRNSAAKILPGDAPLIIPTDIPTLPGLLQEAGYETAAIGKWHLGMGVGKVNWNEEIHPCANDIGFGYSCLVAATNDRVPCVYVEDGRVAGLDPSDPIEVDYDNNFEGEPTALTNPEMLRMTWHHGHDCSIVNGIPRIGYMRGGKSALWVDEDMADYFMGKVKTFIDKQVDRPERSRKPFFLYYGLHEPHVPRAPHGRFAGVTGLGPRGDAVVEADWCVGEVISYLREQGLLENTLVIFTSDNGAVLQDGYNDDALELAAERGHDPNNGLRGGKYSTFDAGQHVPLLCYWEGHTSSCVSDACMFQLDFFASIVSLLGLEMPDGTDSEDFSATLLGKAQDERPYLALEAQGRLTMKEGDYVIIPPYKGRKINGALIEVGNLDDWALFNLKEDPSQRHDLASSEPEVLSRMKVDFLSRYGDHYDPNRKVESLK